MAIHDETDVATDPHSTMECAHVPTPCGGAPQPLHLLLNNLEPVPCGQGHPLHCHPVLAPLGRAATTSTRQRAGPHLLAGGPGRVAPDAAGELEVRLQGEVEGLHPGKTCQHLSSLKVKQLDYILWSMQK